MGFIVDDLVGYDLTADEVVASQIPGALYTGTDGIYQYIKASEALTAGAFLVLDENSNAAQLTTTNGTAVARGVGVAEVSITSGRFGWCWRGCGKYTGIVTNAAAAANLTTTAVAGIAGVGGTTIIGARNTAAGVTATRVAIYASSLMAVNT